VREADRLLAVLAYVGGIYVMVNGVQAAMSLSFLRMFALEKDESENEQSA
jgi:hypothetical protein